LRFGAAFSLLLGVFPQFSNAVFLNIQTLIEKFFEKLKRGQLKTCAINIIGGHHFFFASFLEHLGAHAHLEFIIILSGASRGKALISHSCFHTLLLLSTLLKFTLEKKERRKSHITSVSRLIQETSSKL
jgi:hypothetical protein